MNGIYDAMIAKEALKNFQYPQGQSRGASGTSTNTNTNNNTNTGLGSLNVLSFMLGAANMLPKLTYSINTMGQPVPQNTDQEMQHRALFGDNEGGFFNNWWEGITQKHLKDFNTYADNKLKNTNFSFKSNQDAMNAWNSRVLIDSYNPNLKGDVPTLSKMRTKINNVNNQILSNFNNAVSNMNKQNNITALSNIHALGGALDIMSNNQYNLNNYIKALNDSKITALPNSFQKTTYPSFNQFDLGGSMDFNQFNTGGTHEENSNGGILQGIGPNGFPNLVEQNEVKVSTPNGDYIFSDELEVPKELCKQLKIPVGSTYAEAAVILRKEYDERPNDPISKKGWEQFQNILIESQEAQKQEMAEKEAEIQGNSNEDITNIDPQLAQQLAAEQIIAQQNPSISGMTSEVAQQIANEQQHNMEQGFPVDNNRFDFGGFINKYAPLGIDLIGLATNLATPIDKTAANAYQQAIDDIQQYEPKLNYNYAQYKPVDINHAMNNYWNSVNSQINAVRNTTNPSSNAALQSLAYAANIGAGKRYDELAQQNYNRYRDILDFNNKIDAHNASLIAQAAQINADKDKQKASLLGAKIADINAKTASKQTAIGKSLGNISDMFRSMWMEDEDKKIAILNALSKGVNYTPEMGILLDQLLPGFSDLVNSLKDNKNKNGG